MRKLVLLSMCAALMMPPAALAESPPSEEAAASAHARLLDSIQSGVTKEQALDSTMRAFEDQLRRNALMLRLDQTSPGTISALTESSRPVMEQYANRVKAMYRPRFIAALSEMLTAFEANEIADFFASPIGHRLLAATVESFRAQAIGASIAGDRQVTADDVRQDSTAAGDAALSSFTEVERAELEREIASRPAMLKLAAVRARIGALRAQMEQEPTLPGERQALRMVTDAVLRARMGGG